MTLEIQLGTKVRPHSAARVCHPMIFGEHHLLGPKFGIRAVHVQHVRVSVGPRGGVRRRLVQRPEQRGGGVAERGRDWQILMLLTTSSDAFWTFVYGVEWNSVTSERGEQYMLVPLPAMLSDAFWTLVY
jgi:hypothetical protein